MVNKELESDMIEYNKKDSEIETFVVNAKRGERAAIYALCENLAENILYRTRLVLGDENDAEVVSKRILLRICESIRSLSTDDAFRVWVGIIMTEEIRRFMSMHEKYGNVTNIYDCLEDNIERGSDIQPPKYLEYTTINEAVIEIISSLPVRQREAVLLHYLDDLRINEVAAAMNVPHQNVSRYLAQAHKKVRSELGRQSAKVRIGTLAMLPLDSIIADNLKTSAEKFMPSNKVWLYSALENCQQYILLSSTGIAASKTAAAAESAATASKSPFWLIIGLVSAVFLAGAVALGIMLGGTTYPTAVEQPPAYVSEVTGKIIFTGGDSQLSTGRVNPTHARPSIEGAEGKLTISHWWITAAGSNTILYEGLGDEMNDALSLLGDSGEPGEYELSFRFGDESGYIYRLSGKFYIK